MHQIAQQPKRPKPTLAINKDPYHGLPFASRKYKAVEELARLLKRKFQQSFSKLRLESVTYKREREERLHLKLIQIENILKRKVLLVKMQTVFKLKDFV